MKIFIDTGLLEEIKEAESYGILDGVTTNPSLMKKAVAELKKKGQKVDMEKYIQKVLKAAKGTPVSLEVIGTSYDEIVKQGKLLNKKFKKYGQVVVKVPINPAYGKAQNDFDGIKAIKTLSDAGIAVNCTLVFTPEQALLAAKAGARYVSPFAGRVDDWIRTQAGIKFDKTDYFPAGGIETTDDVIDNCGLLSGIDLVSQCMELFEEYGYGCEIIAASIRNSRQARECALSGADIATLPFFVIRELVKHEQTAQGMDKFCSDVVDEYKKIF